MPEGDPLELEVMTWRIYAALPGLLPEPAFAPLRHYLQPLDNALKRWQLAARIADAFDRYQLYRPDLIRAWSHPGAQGPVGEQAGEPAGEDAWQPLLWRCLIDGVGHHRVAVIDRLLSRLGTADPCPGLPQRVSLFAVSSLPPLLVEVIQALAAHTRVDIYLHCPTDQFWADLVDQKAQARRRLEHPEEADLWEVGSPLLSSWGRQGQALQDLLLGREVPLNEVDGWAPPTPDSLLHRLQHDIYTLTAPAADGSREASTADDSLQVHVCHNALRECQVLHDWLLGLFEAEPDLTPEDCLVMIPEIDAYAPYVEAVFERDETGARPTIPWNLSDTALRDEHPLIQVFLGLLDLPSSRFSHSQVLSYLDVPELAQHFGLDAEAVAQVKDWLAQANLRWGLDGEHKRRLGLPDTEENTWAQVERRLFGGYALGAQEPDSTAFEGIAPIGSVEGARAETLGRFWSLFSRLQEYAERLAAPRTAADWTENIARMLADFFGEVGAYQRPAGGGGQGIGPADDGRLQRIRDALSELAEQVGQAGAPAMGETLPLALIRNWMAERLGTASRHGRYFRGGVTVCGMRPMRSLPFPVICVLGMQDQAFPRRDRPLEFDLMRRHWRPGDPRKGDEDRYLFLETLLCARRRLYLSYIGRDLRKNSERQPSVLLRELLDAIDQRWYLAGGGRLTQALTTTHPLQPFSPRNYRGPDAGFDAAWSNLAQAIAAPRPNLAQAAWPEDRLPPDPDPLRDVTLTQLERFLRHPVRYFVNTRLGVYLREEEPEDDNEPFALAGLPGFLLRQRLVTDGLQGRSPDLSVLAAEGVLPHAAFAALTFERASDKVAPMVERLAPYRAVRPGQVPVDIVFTGDELCDEPRDEPGDGPRRLTGQVGGIYPGLGLLRVRPSKIKGAEILALWLAYLAWSAAIPPDEQGEAREARLVTEDGGFALRAALDPREARAALTGYLRWYWEGLHRPLPMLPKASHALASRTLEGKDPSGAVFTAWNGNEFQDIPGDRDDPYIRFILRGRTGDPAGFAGFPDLALALYGQVLGLGATTFPRREIGQVFAPRSDPGTQPGRISAESEPTGLTSDG
jgi:exodeoxyribonuclease V gamma subunit